MRNLLLVGLLALVALPEEALAHGGSFPPGPPPGTEPAPPVPPPPPPPPPTEPATGGGGGGTPSGPSPGDTTPSGSPKAPAGSSSPGSSGPGAPSGPRAGPRTGGGGSAGAPAGPRGPAGPKLPTSGAIPTSQEDLTQWSYWWYFNQAPYLQLKRRLREGAVTTGNDAYRLGESTPGNAREHLRVSPATVRVVVIPRLLEALRTETSNDIQSACMIALGKVGDPEGQPDGSALAREVWREIQKRLVSSSQELSETAAVSLGIAGSRVNIPVLTAVLENDLAALRELGVPQLDSVSVRTRAFAAYGLGLIGHTASEYDRLVINATLRRMLEGEGRGMAHRDVPVACLIALGLTPLPLDADGSEATVAKRMRDPGAFTSREDQLRFLLGCWADKSINALTRAQVPGALARLCGRSDVPADWPARVPVVETLMRSLAPDSKDDNAMQQSAILALGMLGDCDADPLDREIRATLMRVETELADQQARRFALIALAHAAGNPGRGAGDPLHGVQTRESQANARTYLMGELAHEKGPTRPWAGLALAVLERSLEDARRASSPDAKLALRASLGAARTPEHVGAFAIACGIARERGATKTLLANLSSVRDAEARGHTAVALGLLEEQAAIAPIAEIARQSKYQAELLRSSAIALGLLGDKELVPELIKMLSSATSLPSQAAISSALGTIGDSRSVPALVDLLRDERVTELARAFAAVALGIVADKEDLPWNSKISVGSNYRANPSSLTDGKGGIIDIL